MDLVGRYAPWSGFAFLWGGFTYSDGEYSLHLGAHILAVGRIKYGQLRDWQIVHSIDIYSP